NISIEDEVDFYAPLAIVTTIIQNMVENAIKYSKDSDDAEVKILMQKENKRIRIQVADNGIGIPKKSQAYVFDMFYRANTDKDGSGLGLYILKRAVERLKGEVFLDSTEGEGTTISVLI